MPLIETLVITIIICTILSSIAYWKNVLTIGGSTAAFTVGMIIGFFGHILWLLILLIFLITSFASTKYKFTIKESLGVQEGKKGERGERNVLANGLIPTIIALISFDGFQIPYLSKNVCGILFLTAISVAASDTLASEIGVLSKRVYLITTLEKVKPGTNGGISLLGEFWALIASLYTAMMGWLFFTLSPSTNLGSPILILVPLIVGFLGCQIDSLLGATLERRGIITKGGINIISITIGVIIGWVILVWIGV